MMTQKAFWLPKTDKNCRFTASKLLTGMAVAVLWLAIWWLASALVPWEFVLPSPWDTLRALLTLLPTGEFWVAVLASLGRILLGYAIGCLLGVFLGFCAFFLPPIGAFLRPLMTILRATPVASFILLVILWLQAGRVPILIAVMMVMPVLCGNVTTGLGQTDRGLLELAYAYRMNGGKRLRYIYAPAALPYIGAGCATSLGLAWKAGVAAEVLCLTKRSIGLGMYYAKIYFETDRLFAWTATVILLSFLLEALMRVAFRQIPVIYRAILRKKARFSAGGEPNGK